MDEYFTQKCVTSDALAPQSPSDNSSSGVSAWSQSARCELVVVQENQQAHGASRAVLASIVNMVASVAQFAINPSEVLMTRMCVLGLRYVCHLRCCHPDPAIAKDQRCAAVHAGEYCFASPRCTDSPTAVNPFAHQLTISITMNSQHSASLVSTIQPSKKLIHVDYSSGASLYYASLLQPESSDNDQLLTRLQDDIRANVKTCTSCNRLQPNEETDGESLASSSPATSARAVVVVLDSLNVLLEQSPVQKVLLFLRELRQDPRVGSVIVRFNASTQPAATRQLLTSESTAVALVETPASLSAYPILAKERRREVPKDMHGFVLLLRQKKNGRSSESVDYFQIDGDCMRFFTAAQAEKKKQESTEKIVVKASSESTQANEHQSTISLNTPSSSASSQPTHHHQAALPVRQEEVSFNLSISVEEQLAKSRVQLPYMHQGQPPSSSSVQSGNVNPVANGNSNLFFIDDDDPDWDDDDLDDDLDI